MLKIWPGLAYAQRAVVYKLILIHCPQIITYPMLDYAYFLA
jgi:hypothetical protein